MLDQMKNIQKLFEPQQQIPQSMFAQPTQNNMNVGNLL